MLPIWHSSYQQQQFTELAHAAHRSRRVPQHQRKNKIQEFSAGNHHEQQQQQQQQQQRQYIFPPRIENAIADCFAFLASYRRGPDYVTAVAVECERGTGPGTGCRIRIFANADLPQLVLHMCQGIIETLKAFEANAIDEQTCQQRLLGGIIAGSRDKIREKVEKDRSGNSFESGQDVFSKLLRRISAAQRQHRHNSTQNANEYVASLETAHAASSEIQSTNWSDSSKVVSIVMNAYRFGYIAGSETPSLERLEREFGAIQGEMLSNSRIVFTIGRYWATVLRLIRVSKLHPAALSATQISLEKAPNHSLTFEARVHAEIQLIFFYSNREVQPRVIASSKKACYLCARFIQFQGKYFIKNEHNRLYSYWTLPNIEICEKDALIIRGVLREMEKQLTILKATPATGQDPYESSIDLSTIASRTSTATLKDMSESLRPGNMVTDGALAQASGQEPSPEISSDSDQSVSLSSSDSESDDENAASPKTEHRVFLSKTANSNPKDVTNSSGSSTSNSAAENHVLPPESDTSFDETKLRQLTLNEKMPEDAILRQSSIESTEPNHAADIELQPGQSLMQQLTDEPIRIRAGLIAIEIGKETGLDWSNSLADSVLVRRLQAEQAEQTESNRAVHNEFDIKKSKLGNHQVFECSDAERRGVEVDICCGKDRVRISCCMNE